ncbi:MAG: alcohol dehydrogenase catalytic domain-containing protein [Planctomycetes bacterium]|nr:alcohol dehydrogenase catalytic domain-containing protein [Planctomycetota bacterium]
MRALLFRKSIPRYVVLKALGRRAPQILTRRILPVSLRDVAEPSLPNAQWLRLRPRLSGVCGSDLATIWATGSPYLAPVISMPFVLGHELVGTVQELGNEVTGLAIGDRVVLHPALGCRVRGIEPMCDACSDQRDALCRNVTRGDISAGIQTGYCRDTGGGWGESLVAHQSQVYKVPAQMSDTVAVLTEPFACALHAALRVRPKANDTVLVIGCGSIGLLTIAALRATGCTSRIVASSKHEHQTALARRMGADVVIPATGLLGQRYAAWARELDADVLDAELGKPMVIGGASVTFDCVASSRSIDDAIRFTRSNGTLVLVGMPGTPSGVDWTPMWYKELTVRAAYAYGPECVGDRRVDSFELALDLLDEWGPKVSPLVGDPFELADFRAALDCALYTGRSGVAKTVFAVNP